MTSAGRRLPPRLVGNQSELNDGVEQETCQRRVGHAGRTVDEVREVAPSAQRERVQELVFDADHGSFEVGGAERDLPVRRLVPPGS